MIEILDAEFVATARAKGLSEPFVLFSIVARNAVVPTVTFLGLNIAYLIGTTVIVEQVFNLNGLGSLLLSSILNRDFPVVQAVTIVLGTSVVLINLVTDLVAARLDPGSGCDEYTSTHRRARRPPRSRWRDRHGFWRRARHSPTFIAGATITALHRPRRDPRSVDQPVLPGPPRPLQHPLGVFEQAPARHRPTRSRRTVTTHLGGAHRPPGRRPGGHFPVLFRHADGHLDRVLRWLVRHGRDAHRRRRHRLPFLRLRDRTGLRGRAKGRRASTSPSPWSTGSSTPAPCVRRHWSCASPTTWPRREAAGSVTRRVLWRHVLPEHDHPGRRLRDERHRARHRRRRHPRLPRPRHSTTDPRLGDHDQ